MTDVASNSDTRRAEQARADLLRDIRELKKMGEKMIEKTETAIHKAPLLLGVGAVGVALVGVAVLASRRSKPRFPGFARERSFLAEALRGAALSALGVLSGRITQRLLAAAGDTTQAA
jgi:nitrogenase molybdenum-iron protein alpha/beta subunit